jgi:hypothetical protein
MKKRRPRLCLVRDRLGRRAYVGRVDGSPARPYQPAPEGSIPSRSNPIGV